MLGWKENDLLFATALAISMMDAGSFSGGEFFHLSKGLSSSHGLSVVGMHMAGVDGLKLGDVQSLGLAFSVTLRLLRALASQFEICAGLSSVLFSSSALSSSVG